MGRVADQIREKVEQGDYDTEFALDSPKGVVKQTASGGGGNPRPTDAPEAQIQEFRAIADTDPHVSEAIDTMVDYLIGSGFNIEPANIPGTETEQTDEDIANFKTLIETSSFETVLSDWVWHALVDGTGFLEIVVEDEQFKPKVLPTEEMSIQTDEFGRTVGYEMQGGSASGTIEFDPYDIAVLRFHKHPDEDFGHSLIERCQEQADMIRDMEIDMARFIATKAYPPIMWKLGDEDRPWTEDEIDGFLNSVQNIEPESMLAVGHDVGHDVVGVSSTSSDQGHMKLEGHFKHLHRRIASAIGVPSFLMDVDSEVNGALGQVIMPKFDRRIQRYRMIIRQVVRYQVFVSILGESAPENYDELPPEFEFGQHSSEEERLEADMAIKLVNNNLLTFKAAAKRIGLDPETELPDNVQDISGEEQLQLLQVLGGNGDNVQNPDGGAPTDTGGGADSAGGEATTRQNPADDNSGSDSRNQQSATEE